MALSTFNLTAVPVKFVAIPALAIFAAGTGALAAYVTAPVPALATTIEQKAEVTQVAALPNAPVPAAATEQATQTEQAKPQVKRSCAEQTWPYIDNRCIAGTVPDRNVRVVSAKSDDALPRAAASAQLVTSDTVLRGPGVAPEVDGPAIAKPSKPEKSKQARKRDRNDAQRSYSAFSVPSADGMRPVIVVRPLRINEASRY